MASWFKQSVIPSNSVETFFVYVLQPIPIFFFQFGFAEPRRCGNGTYQPNNYSKSCLTCEEGYYCDNTHNAVYELIGFECPTGHYCPRGTKFATEFPCLTGTWNNMTKLVGAEQCFKCPPRYTTNMNYSVFLNVVKRQNVKLYSQK